MATRSYTYRVFADGMGPGTCKSCGAVITWCETLNGKKMPVDGLARNLVPVQTLTDVPGCAGRAVAVLDSAVNPSHFVTCTRASDYQKTRRRH